VIQKFHLGGGTDTIFTSDETRLYVAAGDHVSVIDTIAVREVARIPIPGGQFIHQITADPEGHFIFVAGAAPTVWPTATISWSAPGPTCNRAT
jgi:hypothetical protein